MPLAKITKKLAQRFPHKQSTIQVEDDIIANHLIGGRWLIPAAYMLTHVVQHLEYLVRKSKINKTTGLYLRHIVFKKPPEVQGTYPIHTQIAEESRFRFCSNGEVLAEGYFAATKTPALRLNHERPRFSHFPLHTFYARIKPLGYGYGPLLQVMDHMVEDGNLVYYRLKDRGSPKETGGINPFLLDGIFQCLLHTAHVENRMHDEHVMFLPYKIHGLRLYRRLPDTCYVVIDRSTLVVSDQEICGSMRVYSKDDELLLDLEEMLLTKLTTALTNPNDNRLASTTIHAYLPHWLPAAPPTPDNQTLLPIVVGGNYTDLNAALAARYGRVIQLHLAAHFTSQHADDFRFDFTDLQAWSQFLSYLTSKDLPLFIYASACEPNLGYAAAESIMAGLLALCRCLISNTTKARLRVPTLQALHTVQNDTVSGYTAGGIAGFLRTVRLESTIDATQLDLDSVHALTMAVLATCGPQTDAISAYRGGVRLALTYQPAFLPNPAPLNPGVYIVAGGAGGIGRQLSLYYAARYPGLHFAWLGRAPYDRTKQEAAMAVRALGAQVTYFQTDVTQSEETGRALTAIRKLGSVRGVIHSGGSNAESLLRSKEWSAFTQVYRAKAQGVAILDQLTQDLPLDFFVIFASTIGITGSIGQCDYAAANAALDSFAHWRNQQAGRPGKTIAIDWTLWHDGGMGRDDSVRHKFFNKTGVIRAAHALPLLERILASTHPEIIVAGNNHYFQSTPATPEPILTPNAIPSTGQTTSAAAAHQLAEIMCEVLANLLNVARSDIDAVTDLRELGLDSIAIATLSTKMEEEWGTKIDATLFYEYQTLLEVASIIAAHPSPALLAALGPPEQLPLPHLTPPAAVAPTDALPHKTSSVVTDIAIIGLAGRYPGHNHVESYWQALRAGEDLISEVPSERWDWRRYFGDPQNSADSKTYSKWGGFLEGVRRFDAEFFRISPREAELLDPQQRLLLEEAWHVLEDAGYAPSSLANSETGVFIGISNNDYSNLLNQEQIKQQLYTATGSYLAIAANRISFFLGLRGPSIASDTACASSLVAICQAVAALRAGECTMAIAGGVNLCLTPQRFMAFSQAGMLAVDGRCKTFDAAADGYVRGEGVGLVLLKPAPQALADGDYIYGIIKGSRINHGGLNTTITAPSAQAQADLIITAVNQAGWDPASISLVEAHGTGTSLGDPLEIRGLKKAFNHLYQQWGQSAPRSAHVAIGAVKTNIGHLEAASGIAGLTKVLMAMKYRYLPQNLHLQHQNPAIDLTASPFYFPLVGQPWQPPRDDHGRPYPRRAGVSSFGFGGANAHLVLEDYENSHERCLASAQPLVFPLAAASASALQRLADNLAGHLRAALAGTWGLAPNLYDIAYTLQTGRTALAYRAAISVSHIDALITVLAALATGNTSGQPIWIGNVVRKRTSPPTSASLPSAPAALAAFWANGGEVPWATLTTVGRRIPLPGYPFAGEDYWLPEARASHDHLQSIDHPFIGRNMVVSDGALNFHLTLHGNEFFLAEHRVAGQPMLPGAAFLAMAMAAGIRVSGTSMIMEKIQWSLPVIGNPGVTLITRLSPQADHLLCTMVAPDERIYAQCQLIAMVSAPSQWLDVDACQARCATIVDVSNFYAQLTALQLQIQGGTFQVIRTLQLGSDEVFAHLELDMTLGHDTLPVHPALMDGAFQICYALFLAEADQRLQVPFAATQIVISAPLPRHCLVHARRTPVSTSGLAHFDIRLSDVDGHILATVTDFVARPFTAAPLLIRAIDPHLVSVPTAATPAPAALLAAEIGEMVKQLLKIKTFDPNKHLEDYGADSINLTELTNAINRRYGLKLTPVIFFEYPTINLLLEYLVTQPIRLAALPTSSPAPTETPAVAVVGMAGIMPGSSDLQQFWEHLVNGHDLVTEVPPARWDWRAYQGDPTSEANRTYCRWGGFMPGIDQFDHEFFGLSKNEAMQMDPQQRLLLALTWHAIEDAGHRPSDLAGTATGVYMGVATFDYYDLIKNHQLDITAHTATGVVHSILANRISWYFDLHGPSFPIDTACSSSLIAVHQAMAAIAAGSCRQAIVGGVNLLLSPTIHISFGKAGMLSPHGRCQTFDAAADGYVRSEGAAVLYLKALADAVADGDPIYAVLRGSATNHGGRAKSLTAPNPNAQADLVLQAQRQAGVDPQTITYIEAHGTGTSLGDPIELEGLKKAFTRRFAELGKQPEGSGWCGIGAVKTNIGHLEAGAGLAGLCKILLAMRHGELPPTIHQTQENPYLALVDSPFFLVKQRQPWPRLRDHAGHILPRRAAISSFGFGGANAHIVLEEYLAAAPTRTTPAGPLLLVLSARDDERLRVQARNLATHLAQTQPSPEVFADLAFTLQVGRQPMTARLALSVNDVTTAVTQLTAFADHASVDTHSWHGQVAADTPIPPAPALDANAATLAAAFVNGAIIDWQQLHTQPRLRMHLPGYPFAPTRCWLLLPPDRPPEGGVPQPRFTSGHQTPSNPLTSDPQTGITQLQLIRTTLVEELQTALQTTETISLDKTFMDLGIDSIFGVGLIGRLSKRLGLALKHNILLDYPTPQQLAAHLAATAPDIRLPQVQFQVQVQVQNQGNGRGILVSAPTLPNQLSPQLITIPQPSTGTLRIKVHACSINYGDLLCIKGVYPTMPPYPFTPGMEVAGEIDVVGEGVSGFKPGDRVVALTGAYFGGHATLALADAYTTVHLPPHVSFIHAVAFPVGYLLMSRALERAAVTAGERVLIQAAGGGVGVIGVQLAHELGAEVFVTAGSDEKLAMLARLGAQHGINYQREDFTSRIRDLTNGAGVDVVINSLGGQATQQGLNLLAPGGRYVETAMMALRSGTPLDLSHLVENQAYFSLDLRRFLGSNPQRTKQALSAMVHTLAAGRIKPVIAQVFPFDQINQAYNWVEERRNLGRVVVSVPQPAAPTAPTAPSSAVDEIAIIGMAGRYPGAADINAFWRQLAEGRDGVSEVPATRWSIADYFSPKLREPGRTYCRHGGFLAQIDQFDAAFFNFSGTEAARTDPQQRLFLETAWQALEQAGYAQARQLRCGVFVGVGAGDYQYRFLDPALPPTAHVFSGNQASILAARIAYHLDLRGPALAIDTACSASLVAIHLACASLRAGEAELAVAGGVFVAVTPQFHVLCSQMGMLSPHGRCAAFDDAADGFVPGEGVGAIVLKPLPRAIADGDFIWGVIRGSGINQDGATNGITAPSTKSQVALAREVYQRFDINPDGISYIETHGTGTPLGDPVEIAALQETFSTRNPADQIALGSVKTNIGHAATAAGIASVTKTLLALHHRQLPPSLHFRQANPRINFAGSPFYVNTTLQPWPAPYGMPRQAAVSAFGFSGTNAHLVLAEAPSLPPVPEMARWPLLICCSGPKITDARRVVAQLADFLANAPTALRFVDLAYTLNVRRPHHAYRILFLAADITELRACLTRYLDNPTDSNILQGQISTPPDLDPALIDRLLARATQNDTNHAALRELGRWFLQGVAIPWDAFFVGMRPRCLPLPNYPFDRRRYWLAETSTSTPTDEPPEIVPQVLHRDWPYVRDHVVAGRALLPGVAYLEFVAQRWERTYGTPVTGFHDLAFLRPLEVTESGVALQVELLADGAFRVIAGTQELAHAQGRITVAATLPPSDLPPLAQAITGMQRESADDFYTRLDQQGYHYGPSLRAVYAFYQSGEHAVAHLRLPAGSGDDYKFHPSLLDGALQAVAGTHHGGQPLLPYVITHLERYASLANEMVAHVQVLGSGRYQLNLTLLTGQVVLRMAEIYARELPDPLDKYCYRLAFQAITPVPGDDVSLQHDSVLIVYRHSSSALHHQLASWHGMSDTRWLKIGDTTQCLHEKEWEIAAGDANALALVLRAWPAPRLVYFLAALQDTDMTERGVFTLLQLLQVLQRQFPDQELTVKVITDNAVAFPDAAIRPWSASLHGFCRAAARELPLIRLVCIDVDLIAASLTPLAATLATEPGATTGELMVLRGGQRYRPYLAAVRMSPHLERNPYRQGGTYVILGGAGGIGMVLARHLIQTVNARVALIGRRPPEAGPAANIATLRQLGGDALYVQADAGQHAALITALAQIKERYGPIHGAIHSAMVLADRGLDQMDAATFHAAFRPKTRATVNFCQALATEPLDFLLLFSSLQSFVGGAGQSNYAAGSTFLDAFASYWRGRVNYPVRLLHWGYWGSVGVVASATYRQRLAEMGLESIEADVGMLALDRFLATDWPQLLVVRAEPRLLAALGVQPALADTFFQHPPSDTAIDADIQVALHAFATLESWCERWVPALLVRLGLQPGTPVLPVAALAQQCGVLPQFLPLLHALLQIMSRTGYAVPSADGYRITTQPLPRWADLVAQGQALTMRSVVDLVQTCVDHFHAVVTGQCSAVAVLFPQGTDQLVKGVYRDHPLADYYHRLTGEWVRTLAESRVAEPLRILEVGGGTASTTMAVLNALNLLRPVYYFTDLSPTLVAQAQQTLARDWPQVHCRVFDLEQDPLAQGLQPGSFDLIVAGNTIHATVDVSKTIARLKMLLRAGGWILLNELTADHCFATLTFGLLDAWWSSTDGWRRLAHTPLLAPEQWLAVLRANGFHHAVHLGLAGYLKQRLVIAQSDGHLVDKPSQPFDTVVVGNDSRLDAIGSTIADIMSRVLAINAADMDWDTPHQRYGVDSILAVNIIDRINVALTVQLRATDLFNFATIRALAHHILATSPQHQLEPKVIPALTDAALLDVFQRVASGELELAVANQLIVGHS